MHKQPLYYYAIGYHNKELTFLGAFNNKQTCKEKGKEILTKGYIGRFVTGYRDFHKAIESDAIKERIHTIIDFLRSN